MKLSAILTILTATLAVAAPTTADDSQVNTADIEPQAALANLPGLNKVQSSHARAIIAETKKEKLGKQGCAAAIATGLVEANMLVYANKNVPSSLKIKHDAVGSDHDSVGIFQQRVSVYKNVKASMDPAKSAALFFREMKRVKGWKTMDVGKLCQRVQRSAYPDRYAKRVGEARKICKAGGI